MLGNLSTLEINCDCWSTSEADSRYISTSDLSPLDARYFVREPFPEGNGIFSMVQEQFTLRVSRSLLPRTVGAGHTGQLQHARTRVRLLEQGPEPRATGATPWLRTSTRRPGFLLCFANSDGAAISSDTSRCIKRTSGCYEQLPVGTQNIKSNLCTAKVGIRSSTSATQCPRESCTTCVSSV